MTRRQDPRKMTHDALLAAKEEFNPELLGDDDEILRAVCERLYKMSVEDYREYLIRRQLCEDTDGE